MESAGVGRARTAVRAMVAGRILAAFALAALVALAAQGPSAADGPPAAVAPRASPPAAIAAAEAAMAGFVENRGQAGDAQVRYYLTANALQVGVTDGGVSLRLRGGDREAHVRATFEGAAPVAPVARDPLPHRSHFFMGSDPAGWRTDVPAFREVRYEGLWAGIDLAYRAADGGAKYEFLLAPGASLGDIRIAYAGAEGLSISNDGELVVRTAAGEIRDGSPIATQGAALVPCAFLLLSADTIGFRCGPYDAAAPLVLDPLVYATYLGGTGPEEARAVAVDAAGDTYVVGETGSSGDFPVTAGAYDTTYNLGQSDVYVAKLDPSGHFLLYATFLGGLADEEGLALAVDAAGDAFVGGSTASADFPTTPGAFDRTMNGTRDAFLAELSPAGDALLYSTFLGGDGAETIRALVLGGAGQAYAAGDTNSTDFPTTAGAFQGAHAGSTDAFVVSLDPAAGLAFSTYLGGSGPDVADAIARDGTGVYVAGSANSTDFPTTVGAFDTVLGGAMDAFVAKLDPTGSTLAYGTYLGGDASVGTEAEAATAVAVDAAGEAVIAGSTDTTNFPTTPGAYDRSMNGTGDAFVARLDASGSALVYATYLGGSAAEMAAGVHLDPDGGATVAGSTDSADFPTTPAAFDTTANGGFDGFAVRLNATGDRLRYATYLGGSRQDVVHGMAVDASGDVHLAGSTDSADFPATGGAYDTTANGGTDAFVADLVLAFPITVDTAPTGLLVLIDGVPNVAPYTFNCDPESAHALLASSPQATADTRYAFASWSDGGAQSHTITCTIPNTYVAAFAATDYRFALATSPSGLLLDLDAVPVGTPYQEWCPAGATHTIGASTVQGSPPTQYVFLRWSDGGAQSHSVACLAPAGYTAFYDTQYQVTVDTVPANRQLVVDAAIVIAPQTFWWSAGSPHTLDAPSPQVAGGSRYTFLSWSDGGAESHAVTADAPRAYTATFAVEYNVTVDTIPAGLRVDVDGAGATAPRSFWCASGASVALSAPSPQGSAPVRFAFTSWSDGGARTHPITCTGPTVFVARFHQEYWTTVDTVPAGLQVIVNGTMYAAPHPFWCPDGASVPIEAPTPQVAGDVRHPFVSWSDGGARIHAIPCAQAADYTATFGTEYRVTIATNPPNLTVTVNGSSATGGTSFWWPAGSAQQIAVPSPQGGPYTRFSFLSWSDGGAQNRTYTVTFPTTITASFETEHRVAFDSASPVEIRVDGGLYPLPRTFWWADDAGHTLAVPSPQAGAAGERFLFASWSDGGAKDRILAATEPLNLTLAVQRQVHLTIVSDHGPPYCDVSSCWYDAGRTATLQANLTEPGAPGVQYRFYRWTGDASSPNFVIPVPMNAPKTVTAMWTTEYLLVVVSMYGNATGSGYYAADTDATFAVASRDVTADGKHYRFRAWSGDANVTAASGTILMDRPHEVVANWEEVSFVTDIGWYWLVPVAVAFLLVGLWMWRRRKEEAGEGARARLPSKTPSPPAAPSAQRPAPVRKVPVKKVPVNVGPAPKAPIFRTVKRKPPKEPPTSEEGSGDLEDEVDLDGGAEGEHGDPD